MHKQHPQTAYRKYAILIGTIFENCDKKDSCVFLFRSCLHFYPLIRASISMTVLYKISFPPVNREKDCFLSVLWYPCLQERRCFVKRRRLCSSRLCYIVLWNEMSMGGRFLKFSSRCSSSKGGCHMTLAEVFALLALIVSLLMLLVQVVHVTFDIAWRISHDNGNNDKKK